MKKRLPIWFSAGALAALLLSGCGGSSDSKDPVVSANSFPYGLSSSDATFDENNDGVDEGLSNVGFTYDAAGRVVGMQLQRQYDENDDGIMDEAVTISMKLDPRTPFDPEMLFFDLISPAAVQAVGVSPSATVRPAKSYFFNEEQMLLLAFLAKAAPVEITHEVYSLSNIGLLALDIPESMLLRERITMTFSYNAQGNPLEISEFFESGSDKMLIKRSVTYDVNGNPTKGVTSMDRDADGWLEDKWIVNFTNTYESGRLIEVIRQDPTTTWVDTFTYAYDETGNRIMERDELSVDGEIVDIDLTEWTYDAAGRKTSESRKEDGNGDGTWDEFKGVNWSYDEAGRLATEEEWSGLEPVVDRTTRFTYDEAGRLIAIRASNPDETDADTTTFDYDEGARFVGYSSEWIYGDFGSLETYTFTYDEKGALAGYTFQEDWDHDGTVDRREEGVATVDGSRIAFAVEMFEGSGEVALSGKRTFDLAFRAGLPEAEMALPLWDYNEELTVAIPVVPAYVLMNDLFLGGMGIK